MKTKVFDLKTEYEAGISAAAKAIQNGALVVFPTETVYGIGADATSSAAVRNIFKVKGRPMDNPLIVHIANQQDLYRLGTEISPLAEKLCNAFWPGSFTVVVKNKGNLPKEISAGLDTVAIRMPASQAARDLILASETYIAAPSANLSGKPSGTAVAHVIADFDGKVPVILDGGDTEVGVESTVCDLTRETPLVLRPGGITVEMIAAVAGHVEVAPAVMHGLQAEEQPKSPGMKYQHYAPKAQVCIVKGAREAVAKAINYMYDKTEEKEKHAKIFSLNDNAKSFAGKCIERLGASAEVAAHVLFDALRKTDEEEIDVVYFAAMEETGMGLAVMNRAVRAAGFQIVAAEKEAEIEAYLAGLCR
ncbi:MAG: L-threonylcarbamoyladenylate synthase [Christensenellaceae bacterium]|jgi:L-threonylcarbamoyladenylate synthase